MAPRFLTDENLSPVVATYMVNTLGVDAVHVHTAGLTGTSNDAVIAFAIRATARIAAGSDHASQPTR